MKYQISLSQKAFCSMMMLAVFFSAFGGRNFHFAHAQTSTPEASVLKAQSEAIAVQAAGSHTITYFQDNKEGAISFTFDDGYTSQITNGISELNARGLKGTFFVITGSDWINGHVPWPTLQSLVAQGHEVAAHTVTHQDLTTLSEGEMRWEMTESQAAIMQNVPGQACASLSYPTTASNPTVQAAASEYFVAARGGFLGDGYLNYYQSGSDQSGSWTAMNFYNVGSRSSDGLIPSSDQYFNSLLNTAATRHAWFSLHFHTINSSAFATILDYIQGRPEYWIDTFCNISRYMKERLNSTVQVVTETSSETRLNIVMNASLSTSIYNVPLTIRSTVPASWTQVIVQQGSDIQTTTPVLEGTEKVVYYNALPNGGEVILTPPNPVPAITLLNPASTFSGGSAFTLAVTGTNFVNDSIVRWNGTDHATTYVSSTQLTATILASDIGSIGTANVRVFNPAPGGGISNQLSFSINAKPITITVNASQSKTYGDADPVFTYVSSDPAATFTGVLNRASGENVGTYVINQGTLTVVGSNYIITSFVPANFTISPKPASVTPNAVSKTVGSIDPVLSGTLTGFLPGDSVTAVYTRIAGETVAGSPYTIITTLNPAGALGNYNITYNPANLTITRLTQTITVTVSAPSTAAEGSSFNVAATASSGLPVAITSSGVCTGSGNNAATITMNSGSGLCSVFYAQAGNVNYEPAVQIQNNVNATQKPSITSADNATFSLGLPGTFTITTMGNPATPMAITTSGSLPAGITFVDNNDGTATLSGIPVTVGIYFFTFTANNGVLPNASQSFKLTVKNGPIIGAQGIKLVSNAGSGNLRENDFILDTTNMTEITAEFSQDVNDPSDDTDLKDVTNPLNYILVLGSSAGEFQTVSCSAGLVAPDIAISVDSVTYSNNNGAGPFIATLHINGGNPLNVVGVYRLYVCGTTSIADAGDVNLKLAGNGTTPGTDFLRNFRIQTRVASNNSNNNSSNAVQTVTKRKLLVPVTGFAPHRITPLPMQPADQAYKSLGDLRIEIPTLGINYPIVGALMKENGWDLTWLKDSVAYLEGSAYPTLAGNTVLTAHVLDANNNLGPFSDIKGMQSGEKIYIHANGQIYIYQVQENSKILPTGISDVFKHEEYSWVTLVTCEDYNAKTGLYTHRRMVRAVLISVIQDK